MHPCARALDAAQSCNVLHVLLVLPVLLVWCQGKEDDTACGVTWP